MTNQCMKTKNFCFLLVFNLATMSNNGIAKEQEVQNHESKDDVNVWLNAFRQYTLKDHLSKDTKNVIVVRAGRLYKDLDQSASALIAALKERSDLELVMDDHSLGNLKELTDASIVEKAKHLPIEQIIIVRVFENTNETGNIAVVTVYDKHCQVVSAFSAKPGKDNISRNQENMAEGVSLKAATAVASTLETQRKKQKNAHESYEENFVWFEDYVGVGQYNAIKEISLAYRGKYKKPLRGIDFYEAIGREDLVKQYRNKSMIKWSMIIGGCAVAVGGAIYFAAGRGCDRDVGDPDFSSECIDFKTEDAIALGISGAGLFLSISGWFINPHPVSANEARQLADQYNQSLKKELGLPKNHGAETKPLSFSGFLESIQVAPYAVQQGGGLLIQGSF